MIMQWKEQEDKSFVTVWQGITYKLVQDEKTQRWQLRCNGKRVKESSWLKAKIAMQQIDSKQQKLIMEANKTVKAVIRG